MNRQWLHLSEREKRTFDLTLAFLSGRLEERRVVEWAIDLDPSRRAEKLAVQSVIKRIVLKGLHIGNRIARDYNYTRWWPFGQRGSPARRCVEAGGPRLR